MIITVNESFFIDMQAAMEFLIENEIIPHFKHCSNCNQRSRLVLQNNRRLVYRCSTNNCQLRTALINTKIPIFTLLQSIYFLLHDESYKNMSHYLNLSDSTIARIKKKLCVIFQQYLNTHPVYLGGLNTIVEVDETVLSRKGIIRSPTSNEDYTISTVWILGAYCVETGGFILKRIPNRRIETLTEVLGKSLLIGTMLFSDGYPSYPSVAENLGVSHRVVNHNRGFINEDGTHTNNIEGFWSHLKSSMRKENGVKRTNIDNWLIQYTFKRRYIMGASKEEFAALFIAIIKLYFQ